MMTHLDQSERWKSPPFARPLKPYTTPSLTVFGSVEHLTNGIGGSNTDHGQANNTKRGVG